VQEREQRLDLTVERNDDGTDGLHVVVDPAHLVASDGLARHRHGLLTGLSVLAVSPDAVASERIAAVLDAAPAEIRVELVLCDPPRSSTERLDLLAWPWSAVPAGPDRASTLDAATAASTGEFIVIGSEPEGDVGPTFERLGEALGLMWINGADAMVIDQSASPDLRPVPDGPEVRVSRRLFTRPGQVPGASRVSALHGPAPRDGRAELLATVLGLRRGDAVGLVVLRRWVARFLFEEIGRAIDPYHELAERIRLLELRLIEVRRPS